MHIEILPGFSPKNEDWALATQRDLHNIGTVNIVRWPHWQTNSTAEGWIEKQAAEVADRTQSENTIIIAKSIGTLVAVEALKRDANIDRLILCGVPIQDFQPGDEHRYQILKNFDSQRVAVFQNEHDHHGNYEQAFILLQKINPKIHIQSKPRDDHEYPYSEDFISFISETTN